MFKHPRGKMEQEINKKFMKIAIEEAKKSAKKGNYALGCVIVKDEKIIAKGMNKTKTKCDPTLHGEIDAIRNACKKLNSHYLQGCILYTTLEPCPMCTSAAIWAKMKGIVFGAFKEDAQKNSGKDFSWRQIDISSKEIIAKGKPKLNLIEGFMREDCLNLFNLTK